MATSCFFNLVPRTRTLWPTGPFSIRWWHCMTTMHKAQRIWNSVKATQLTFSVKVHKHSGIFLLLILLLMLHTSDGVRQVFFPFCSEWWVVRRTRCWKYRHLPSKFCSSGYRQHQWGINRLTQPLNINSGCITLQWIRTFSCAATVLRGPSVKNYIIYRHVKMCLHLTAIFEHTF